MSQEPSDPEQEAVDAVVDLLAALRERKGVSRYRMAQLTGLHRTTIARVEEKSMSPTLYTLFKVAGALEADLGALIKKTKKS